MQFTFIYMMRMRVMNNEGVDEHDDDEDDGVDDGEDEGDEQ